MSVALHWARGRVGPLLGHKILLTAALTVFFGVGWVLIPRQRLVAPHVLPMTPIDHGWPFVEGWVFVYLSIGLFNVVAPYLTVDRAGLHRHARGFTAITVIAFACFALFPVETPAPTDRARTALYALLLADTRLNSFPSLHASYTVFGLLYWTEVLADIPFRWARRLTAAGATAWATALMLSVLFLKQHYVLDLVAGGALGAAVYWLSFRRPQPDEAAAVAPLGQRREMNP